VTVQTGFMGNGVVHQLCRFSESSDLLSARVEFFSDVIRFAIEGSRDTLWLQRPMAYASASKAFATNVSISPASLSKSGLSKIVQSRPAMIPAASSYTKNSNPGLEGMHFQ